MSNEFDFGDLTPVEIDVVGPDKLKYVLKEANGHAAKVFNNARTQGIVFDDGKLKSITGAGELEPLLVSLCLFGEGDRPVQQKVIEKWPERVVKKLFNKAKEISHLLEEVNPLKGALEVALTHKDSPVSFEDFKSFVDSLDDKRVKSLKDLLEKDEDAVKNSPQSTTVGSE